MSVPIDVKVPEEVIAPANKLTKLEEKKTDGNSIVHQGELKKKNKFFWNQARNFILYQSGRLEYYKDKTLLRGFIQLTHATKVTRTAKDKFEIEIGERTYFLSESETAKLSTDEWIDKIREIAEQLK